MINKQLHCLKIVLILLVAGMAAGCVFNGDKKPVYAASEEVPPLRVPEGLSKPETRATFEIPGYSLPELAARGDETRPPRVLTSAEAEKARSRIRFGPTGLYLEVDDEAASVWRRLGFALNRGDMTIDRVLDDQRRYRVQFSHDPILVSERGWFSKLFLFWKSPDYINFSGTYLFEVQRETTDTTRVVILDEDGKVLAMQQAEFVLARLQERLG
ncbi:MAG TPA: hypothetical protein VJ902_09295 [Wenzhouxiangellaceae bacterium]|nr:hypothetical protein [Wenzhouxiangellaceae bacterium]